MAGKIDRRDLDEIVREAAHLELREEGALTVPEARDVLREVDVSPERLEAAREAVALRREEARVRRRGWLLAGAVLLATSLVLSTVVWRARARTRALAEMTTVSFALKSGPELVGGAVARAAHPEVTLEAVLGHPPQGRRLELTCDWTGPAGTVLHQNRWETKAIDRGVWTTHCRRAFGGADPPGAWTVTMKAGERVLATQRLQVE